MRSDRVMADPTPTEQECRRAEDTLMEINGYLGSNGGWEKSALLLATLLAQERERHVQVCLKYASQMKRAATTLLRCLTP